VSVTTNITHLEAENAMVDPNNFYPVFNDTIAQVYEQVFAPWVKDLGLTELTVSKGRASARLPANPKLNLSSGAVCGQAIMAAVDTVVSMAMFTTDRATKGTVYQHTHFLRAALNDDFVIEAKVLRFGKSTAYAEATVSFATSGELVARASAEFAF
jgi:acyl-coenzyme A thioesterase PaaI-like protein